MFFRRRAMNCSLGQLVAPADLSGGFRLKTSYITRNYKELREQLLLRCDRKRLKEDKKRWMQSKHYKNAAKLYCSSSATKADRLEYLRDRPIFDQFEEGPGRHVSEMRNACAKPQCDRRKCDLFHYCPDKEDRVLDGWCHCTKTKLLWIWYVVNRHTKRKAWVGSMCVHHFSEQIQLSYIEFKQNRSTKGNVLRCKLLDLRDRINEALKEQDNATLFREHRHLFNEYNVVAEDDNDFINDGSELVDNNVIIDDSDNDEDEDDDEEDEDVEEDSDEHELSDLLDNTRRFERIYRKRRKLRSSSFSDSSDSSGSGDNDDDEGDLHGFVVPDDDDLELFDSSSSSA